MNIVLYEQEHFEILDSLIRVFGPGNRLHLLIPQGMDKYLDAGPGNPEIHFLPGEPAKHPQAVKELCREQSAGLLVLATVSFRHWQFAAVCRQLQPQTSTLLLVHDLRDLLAPVTGNRLRGWLQYAGKLRLRGAVSAYAVLLEEMKSYLRAQQVRKPVYVLPGSFYKEAPAFETDADRVVLGIPGSIDATRRNYDDVKNFVGLLQERNREHGYVIRLIGGVTAHTPAWIDDCPGFIEHKSGSLSQEAFDQWMQGCELAWLPLAPVFRRPGHPDEQYGVTKSSGAFFDTLRHGKPLLAPDDLPVPEILASALLRYSDATYLYYLLEALKQNPVARRRLQELAREQSAKVRSAEVRARLRPLIGYEA
ncbi:MAG: hypothetical protein EOO16_02795 [Chitinophagaceae bacterium]|nr:MAG: hypothetical protein EOO16_02795 [Chitinophagaceae bacterium]